MAVTLGSTGITFPDATTQTTAASGGGAPQATFTAAAAITAGNVVQFTTGTNVEAVTGTVTSNTVLGSNTVLSGISTPSAMIASAYDPNTAGSFVVVSIRTTGMVIQAGTTSVNTTTMGTAVTTALTGSVTAQVASVKVMFDPVTAGKGMVVLWDDSASGGGNPLIRAFIFTVSGTTVTVQSSTTLMGSGTYAQACSFSYYGQDIFVYNYVIGTTMYAKACSISTYTITQGTQTSIATTVGSSTNTRQLCIDLDYSVATPNLLGAAYSNNSSTYPYAVLFTVVPATKVISAGSPNNMRSVATNGVSIAFDPLVATRLAVGFYSTGGTYAYISCGTISGTAITQTNSAYSNVIASAFCRGLAIKFLSVGDSTNKMSVLCIFNAFYYSTCAGSYYDFSFNSGIASSTAYNANFSWISEWSAGTGYSSISGISSLSLVSGQVSKVALPMSNASTTNVLKFGSAALTYTNLNSTKLIGIANASASSSAPVVVNVFGGVDTHQTGLTTNSTYYVTQAGVLTTTSTSPNLLMGRAVSSTSILIKGLAI